MVNPPPALIQSDDQPVFSIASELLLMTMAGVTVILAATWLPLYQTSSSALVALRIGLALVLGACFFCYGYRSHYFPRTTSTGATQLLLHRLHPLLLACIVGLFGGLQFSAPTLFGIVVFFATLIPLLCLITPRFSRFEIPLTLAVLCGSSVTLYNTPTLHNELFHGYDAYFHMFAAGGYVQDWWNTWDPRWYGGFSKTSYPPLAHQLVALVSIGTSDIKTAYQLVVIGFLGIAPFGAYQFASAFVERTTALRAATFLLLLPSIRSMVYVIGSFAGFVSLMFLLFAIGALGEYYRTGQRRALVAAALLAACTVASHHNTGLFFLPAVGAVVWMVHGLQRSTAPRKMFMRGVWSVLVCGLASLLVILPFWWWLPNFDLQTPIPHPSRDNYWQQPSTARLFFWDFYGVGLVLVPLLVGIGGKVRGLVPLVIAYLIFLVLGLGGTTEVPRWVYGEDWQWLTFERYGIWATILLLPLAGMALRPSQHRFAFYLSMTTLLLLVVATVAWANQPAVQRITPVPVNLTPVFSYIAQAPECGERYLALGYAHQLPEFSATNMLRTLDGEWHTARLDPLLRASGVGSLNNALYWPTGRATLDQFLSRTQPLPATCVFVNAFSPLAKDFGDILEAHGWRMMRRLENQTLIWRHPNLHTRTLEPVNLSSATSAEGGAWGILPLLTLGLALRYAAPLWTRSVIAPTDIY